MLGKMKIWWKKYTGRGRGFPGGRDEQIISWWGGRPSSIQSRVFETAVRSGRDIKNFTLGGFSQLEPSPPLPLIKGGGRVRFFFLE